jgi:hypothetical protein
VRGEDKSAGEAEDSVCKQNIVKRGFGIVRVHEALLLEEGAICCRKWDGEKNKEDRIKNCIHPEAGPQ